MCVVILFEYYGNFMKKIVKNVSLTCLFVTRDDMEPDRNRSRDLVVKTYLKNMFQFKIAI